MTAIDYLHVELHSGCSGGPGSATGIIAIIHFLYVYMYQSLCNPLAQGVGWLYIGRSEDVQ